PTFTSTAFRRAIRPRGRAMRRSAFDSTRTASRLVARVNSREVTVGPPRTAPTGALTIQVVADRIMTQGMPSVHTGGDVPPVIGSARDGMASIAAGIANFRAP